MGECHRVLIELLRDLFTSSSAGFGANDDADDRGDRPLCAPLYEHPMINWPEILSEVEHWAGGFLGPEQPPYR